MSPKDSEEPTDPNLGTVPNVAIRGAPGTSMPDLGILNTLLQDTDVTEIMVNDLRNIALEKRGQIVVTPIRFKSTDELNRVVRNLLEPIGRLLTYDQPLALTSLPDGSRVHIVGPPITEFGPCITIRRFPKRYSLDQLYSSGMMDKRMTHFLNACIQGKQNILISGGTGTGKTTLLNALLALVPPHERVVTIEDSAEIPLILPNQVKMMTRPKGPASEAITSRDLVLNALRMRPDRIIVGECRGPESLDMIQAMNTGHQGSMTTIHSNHPRDALFRLETLIMGSGFEMPLDAIRRLVSSAIQLIIQIRRFRSGERRIISIQEITGIEQNAILLQEVFSFEPKNPQDPQSDEGSFRFHVSSKVVESLKQQGIKAIL
jgi:pilus assembly protein CpaF